VLVHGRFISVSTKIDVRGAFGKLMLMTSWVGSFDTEINNCSANLNCFVEAG
jgi:hypothetical protein